MRKILTYLVIAALLAGCWWLFEKREHMTGIVQQYVENGEFVTLKARYTPELLMESHKKELLVDSQHTYLEPELKFHPYLLMEVKYIQPDHKSREGVILWSLVDGEMVLSTETWEKTHGFEDAINADATRNDFKVMQALARNRNSSSVEKLQKELQIEKDTLHQWLESAISKHLVVQKGNEVQLHLQDPKILVNPETKVSDWLVKKPYNHAQRISSKYSASKVQKTAKAAFGDDFTIKSISEVYLPVYRIEVANPDGSTLTSYWNALTGQRMAQRYGVPSW